MGRARMGAGAIPLGNRTKAASCDDMEYGFEVSWIERSTDWTESRGLGGWPGPAFAFHAGLRSRQCLPGWSSLKGTRSPFDMESKLKHGGAGPQTGCRNRLIQSWQSLSGGRAGRPPGRVHLPACRDPTRPTAQARERGNPPWAPADDPDTGLIVPAHEVRPEGRPRAARKDSLGFDLLSQEPCFDLPEAPPPIGQKEAPTRQAT